MGDKYNRDMAECACEILKREDAYGKAEYKCALDVLWRAIGSGGREQLRQLLFFGPTWDGNVISKSARSILFEHGLAARVSYKGDQGYSAATYLATTLFNASGEEKPEGYRQYLPQIG